MSVHVVAPGSSSGADLGLCRPGNPGSLWKGHLGVPAGSRSCSSWLCRQLGPERGSLRPGRDALNCCVDSKMWYLGYAEMLVCRSRNEGSSLQCLMTKVADGCKIRLCGWIGVACEAATGVSQSCKAGQWERCRMADDGIWAAVVQREQNSHWQFLCTCLLARLSSSHPFGLPQ